MIIFVRNGGIYVTPDASLILIKFTVSDLAKRPIYVALLFVRARKSEDDDDDDVDICDSQVMTL